MKNCMCLIYVLLFVAGLGRALGNQATISSMSNGLEPITESPEVVVIRSDEFLGDPARVGLKLGVGDEVRCRSGKISVKLTYGENTSILLSEPFRLVVLPLSDGQGAFWVHLLNGNLTTVAEEETRVTVGEVTLGSAGTRYEVRTRGSDGQKREPEILVFEGGLTLQRGGTKSDLVSGQKTRLQQSTPQLFTASLEEKDYGQAANAYTRMDLVASAVVGESTSARRSAYTQLAHHYLAVLHDPQDQTLQMNLAVTQLKLEIPNQAMYSLNRAHVSENKQNATVQLLKGVAFSQMNNLEEADKHYQQAKKLNPSVDGGRFVSEYKADPKAVLAWTQFNYIMPSIVLETEVKPRKVTNGRRAEITIRALTENKNPIANAQVIIQTSGGKFHQPRTTIQRGQTSNRQPLSQSQNPIATRSAARPSSRRALPNRPQIIGKTDQSGYFRISWSCERCEPSYVFSVTASKPGYVSAESRSMVTTSP